MMYCTVYSGNVETIFAQNVLYILSLSLEGRKHSMHGLI